jgi:hypothetical protein
MAGHFFTMILALERQYWVRHTMLIINNIICYVRKKICPEEQKTRVQYKGWTKAERMRKPKNIVSNEIDLSS